MYAGSPSLVTRTCKKAVSSNRPGSLRDTFSIIGFSISSTLVISELGCHNSMSALDS